MIVTVFNAEQQSV